MEMGATAVAQERHQHRFNWRQFWILWGAAVFGAVAVQPYILHFVRASNTIQVQRPLWVLVLSGVVQAAVLAAVAITIGMRLGNPVGLGTPVLEASLAGESVGRRIRSILLVAVPTGAIAASVAPLIDKYYFVPRIPGLAQPGLAAPVWMGFLASFYGGIDEELLVRFGFLTLLAWVFGKLARMPVGSTTPVVFWTANIIAALMFGVGHLSAARMIGPLTTVLVLRTVALNAYLGVILGYLYWKRGLECAMAAHFSADIVLHVLVGG
jgi:membrane protease YdiL (CAAX protease family)